MEGTGPEKSAKIYNFNAERKERGMPPVRLELIDPNIALFCDGKEKEYESQYVVAQTELEKESESLKKYGTDDLAKMLTQCKRQSGFLPPRETYFMAKEYLKRKSEERQQNSAV